jgi:hypothetical protein
MDSTMMMRVKAVMPKTIEGSTVMTDINTRICSEREYVVSPVSSVLDVRAERLSGSFARLGAATKIKEMARINALRIGFPPRVL